MSLRKRVNSILFMLLIPLALSLFFLLSACAGANTASPPQTTSVNQSPPTVNGVQTSDTQGTPAVKNLQAGDIPDTQAFITYRSDQGGYQLEVPEGWARTITGTGVSFSDKFNSVAVQVSQAKTAPTVASVSANEAITLQKTGAQDVKVQSTQSINVVAVLITYTSNSDPNAVTGKPARIENNRYLFFQNGKIATLTLSAALGADNVDQWKRMARSFKWV